MSEAAAAVRAPNKQNKLYVQVFSAGFALSLSCAHTAAQKKTCLRVDNNEYRLCVSTSKHKDV